MESKGLGIGEEGEDVKGQGWERGNGKGEGRNVSAARRGAVEWKHNAAAGTRQVGHCPSVRRYVPSHTVACRRDVTGSHAATRMRSVVRRRKPTFNQPPGLQLPPQPLRGLLPVSLLFWL